MLLLSLLVTEINLRIVEETRSNLQRTILRKRSDNLYRILVNNFNSGGTLYLQI